MLIVCPSCATAFRVTENALGETGRQVRCAHCRTVWLATRANAQAEPAEASAARPAAPGSAPRAVPPAPPKASEPAEPVEDEDWGAAFAEEARAKEGAAEAEPEDAPVPDVPADEAPSIAPEEAAEPLPEPVRPSGGSPRPASRLGSGGGGMLTSLKRPRRPGPPPRRAGGISVPPTVAIIVIGLAILATFFIGREQVVRQVPDAATVYERLGMPVNLRGIDFRDIKGANEIVDGVVVLVVEGTLVNITGQAVTLPRLRLAVRDATGKEIYTWTATPPKPQLGPGEAVPFRSRLASPPPDGSSVEVRFFTRQDAGGR